MSASALFLNPGGPDPSGEESPSGESPENAQPGGGFSVAECTAYTESARLLAEQLVGAEVDRVAFARRLKRCELERCRATCCHDGVVLGADEVRGIRDLVTREAARLRGYGWGTPPDRRLFRDEVGGRVKTATRPAAAHELAEDFPPHFPKTRCVFLDSGHRCVLQRLSVDAGRHPWFWKPLSCWMHPLVLRPAGSGRARPLLTVPAPAEDPEQFGSCTHCGHFDSSGEAVSRVLVAELRMLESLSGRRFDLL